MAHYTITLDRPHSTRPTICWTVHVWDLVQHGGGLNHEFNGHSLWVPDLDAWTPDTLRLILYELSAYLPGHDPDEALVRIGAKYRKRPGRVGKHQRLVFDDRVTLAVEARGWRAEVWTWSNDARDVDGKVTGSRPKAFDPAMQEWLLDLAEQSPFPLASVRPEFSEDGCVRGQQPSRLNLQLGHEALYDEVRREWRHDIADHVYRTQEILRRLRGR